MQRAIRWSAAALVVAFAALAVIVSRHTSARTVTRAASVDSRRVSSAADLAIVDPGPPPSIAQASGWLNTPAIDDADLRGKVVLYDFWTFGCVNCQHTLPNVKAWHARYAADGLMIVSIHTPEFTYEADRDNVVDFVSQHEITYPVLLDPERRVWSTWRNHYWPAFYLYDRDGRLRLRHYGEGAYEEMEDAVRALLDVAASSPRATAT